MGESDRYLERRIRKISIGDDTNAVMALIAINGLVFICMGMVQLIYQMSQSTVTAFQYQVLRWAVLPAKLSTLVYEPWTIITYMFIHTGVIMTIVNLLWLWAFGNILQNIAGNKVIFPVYLYGGVAGAVFFIGASYAIPAFHDTIEYMTLAGAYAPILALAAAVTTLVPRYRIFPMLNGGIPLWVVSLAYLLITFASGTSEPAQLIAIAGGGLIGFLFMYNYNRGRDWGLWMNELYSWFVSLFDPNKNKKAEKSLRNTMFYKTDAFPPFTRQPVVTQEKVDLILDKINVEGYDRLTEEEKSILRKAAEEDY